MFPSSSSRRHAVVRVVLASLPPWPASRAECSHGRDVGSWDEMADSASFPQLVLPHSYTKEQTASFGCW